MTVCKFFLEGRCRFGQNCKFEHSYKDDSTNKGTPSSQQLNIIIKQIVGEIIIAEKGGQWPLSCFAPIKEGSNIPGWEDISPEEIRWKMYEARRNGTLNQCINEVNQLYSEAEKRRNALKQPTVDKINLIINMLRNKKENNTPSNLFASNSINNSSNIFGGSAISERNQNVFGNKIPSNENIFGNASQPSVSQGSIFGGSSNGYMNQNIFGGFNSQSNFNQNIFSNSQAPALNIFSSTPLIGNSSNTSNQSQFFNAQQNNPTNTPFSSPNSSNIFSEEVVDTSTLNSSNGLFQSTPMINQQETNIFGGHKTENLFNNQPSSIKPGKGFDWSRSEENVSDNQFQFSGQHSAIDSSVYSKKIEISEEEIKAFMAATFTFGKIPLKPPPLEYCK